MKRFLALLLCVFGALASPMRAEVELSFDFYYDQLNPLGEWAEVEGYGYVWHPTGVDEDWAPYTDGYWSYTDAGWTWVSYEDWGGICYHYGRWTRIEDYGWCWVPGYEWGPAWVSWRRNDDYVGWAPLPPECDWEPDRGFGVWVDVNYDIGPRYYSFCRWRDFGAPVIRHVLFPRIRNVDICFSTVNITNITYNHGYGCVYNGGFDYDYVRVRCERPIPALKLVQNTTNIYINNNGGNVVVNAPRGNALVVATPRLAANYRQYTRKPAALKTFKRDTVARGWAGVDQQETKQRLVSKMREETKGLTPANAPARPVAKEALAAVPKEVNLEARPVTMKRLPAERAARAQAAVEVPVDPAAIRRAEKGRGNSRGETAEAPVTQPQPRGRSAETPRGNETPVAGTDDNKAGGLRKRPGRPEGENTRPAATETPNTVTEERATEAGKPGRPAATREGEPRNRVTTQEAPARERMEQPERGPGLRRPATEENTARQAQENAERANADRQMKQRDQAEAAQNAAERAQRQRNAQQQQNSERAAEMQRQQQAQENANRARTEQAEAAQRQNAQREAAERAAAGQRERAAEAQRERAMDAQRERAAAQQAEAQRERAAQQSEARQRASEAQRERAMENQRAAAQAQQNEARQRAMDVQRERAAAQQAAQQNEARQRAMENQRAAAAQAQERAAAQAQAQAQAQQRAAAENAARRPQQAQPQQGDPEDPRKRKRGQ